MSNGHFRSIKTAILFLSLAFEPLTVYGFSDSQQQLLDMLTPQIIGEARDMNSGEVLYREIHYWTDDGLNHFVLYRDVDDQLIAEKLLTYSGLPTQPELWQMNFLSGELIAVDVDSSERGDRVSIKYRSQYKEENSAERLSYSKDLVIDAGFDRFITGQWANILAQTQLTFDYLVPSRGTSYEFVVRLEECREKAVSQNNNVCFFIEPKSWWLRRFVSPIQLVYEEKTRRLMHYAGLGNIGTNDSDYLKVNITYRYKKPVTEGVVLNAGAPVQDLKEVALDEVSDSDGIWQPASGQKSIYRGSLRF